MIAVAQPATRPWDGQRVLRFLTGLAMLALAVTLRLPVPVTEMPVTPVPAAASSTISTAATAPRTVTEPAAPAETIPHAPLTLAGRIPAGEFPGTTGSRAPPTAR